MEQLSEAKLAKILLVLQEAEKLFYYIIHKEETTVPCKAGCFNCCYEPVEATMAEAHLVADFIRQSPESSKRWMIDGLQEWLTWFQENEKPKHPGTYRKHKQLCPFCREGICTIYPLRPISCRTYVVPDGPGLCDPDRTKDGTLPFIPASTVAAWIALDRRVYIFHEVLCAVLGLTEEKGLLVKENTVPVLARIRREAMEGNPIFLDVEKAVGVYQEILKAASD